MKITALVKVEDPTDKRPYKYTVLINGVERSFDSGSLFGMKQNIIMRDKFCDATDVDQDLILNYPEIK